MLLGISKTKIGQVYKDPKKIVREMTNSDLRTYISNNLREHKIEENFTHVSQYILHILRDVERGSQQYP